MEVSSFRALNPESILTRNGEYEQQGYVINRLLQKLFSLSFLSICDLAFRVQWLIQACVPTFSTFLCRLGFSSSASWCFLLFLILCTDWQRIATFSGICLGKFDHLWAVEIGAGEKTHWLSFRERSNGFARPFLWRPVASEDGWPVLGSVHQGQRRGLSESSMVQAGPGPSLCRALPRSLCLALLNPITACRVL